MKASAGAWVITSSLVLTGCGGGASPTDINVAASPASAAAAIGADRQVQIEDRLVSVFENATLVIQYGYIQQLGDGRGYTAGRAGFTTKTGDLLQVVEAYSRSSPSNALVSFLPTLRMVNGTASTTGLDGLPAAWQSSAADPLFIAAQDDVNDRLYRQPARQLAARLGVVTPLAKAALYEAGIQHGYGDDYDSVNQIAQRASNAVGGAPITGGSEALWLKAFLAERKRDLLGPANAATAAEWAASVDRANAMQSIFDSGNLELSGSIRITVFGQSYTI